jgi:hypothetical protein
MPISDKNESPPSLTDRIMFFLLFSGPPKFRVRDAMDSLDNVIDWVVLLQILVWLLAGLWIANKLWFSKPRVKLTFSSLEKISLWLVACLTISLLFSEAPGLTAFKIYQLLVTILFASLFVRLHGIQATLNCVFFASAVLCIADVIALLAAPDMVLGETEFGSIRFTGALIADTGVVGTLALVLLLCSNRKRSRAMVAAGIALFGSVFVFSLMRTSYLAFLVFLLLAIWKAPEIRLLQRIARWALFILPLTVIGGALSRLEEYRSAETLWSLSDRLGLWTYLIDMMWTKSPWFGLGYFAASRIYGPEYNKELGTAHSVFVEVLAGGGVVSFTVFIVLWIAILVYALRVLRSAPMTPTSFAVISLFVVTTSFVLIGSELESDPAALTLWVIVISLPMLAQRHAQRSRTGPERAVVRPGHPPLVDPI